MIDCSIERRYPDVTNASLPRHCNRTRRLKHSLFLSPVIARPWICFIRPWQSPLYFQYRIIKKLPFNPMSTTITKVSKILISFDFYVKPFPLLIFLPFKNNTLDARKRWGRYIYSKRHRVVPLRSFLMWYLKSTWLNAAS